MRPAWSDAWKSAAAGRAGHPPGRRVRSWYRNRARAGSRQVISSPVSQTARSAAIGPCPWRAMVPGGDCSRPFDHAEKPDGSGAGADGGGQDVADGRLEAHVAVGDRGPVLFEGGFLFDAMAQGGVDRFDGQDRLPEVAQPDVEHSKLTAGDLQRVHEDVDRPSGP